MIDVAFVSGDVSYKKSAWLVNFFAQVEAAAAGWKSAEYKAESEEAIAFQPVPIGSKADVFGMQQGNTACTSFRYEEGCFPNADHGTWTGEKMAVHNGLLFFPYLFGCFCNGLRLNFLRRKRLKGSAGPEAKWNIPHYYLFLKTRNMAAIISREPTN